MKRSLYVFASIVLLLTLVVFVSFRQQDNLDLAHKLAKDADFIEMTKQLNIAQKESRPQFRQLSVSKFKRNDFAIVMKNEKMTNQQKIDAVREMGYSPSQKATAAYEAATKLGKKIYEDFPLLREMPGETSKAVLQQAFMLVNGH